MKANRIAMQNSEAETATLILSTAYNQIIQSTTATFTVESLASHLGMSKKTIYKHFSSKVQLLLSAVDYAAHKEKYADQNFLESDNSANSIIETLNLELISYPGEFISRIRKYSGLDRRIIIAIEKLQMDHNEALITILSNGQKSGVIRGDLDPTDLSRMLMLVIHSLSLPSKNLGFQINEQSKQILFDIVCRGCMTRKGRLVLNE